MKLLKKTIFILGFLFFATNAFGQQLPQNVTYTIDNFSKLLTGHSSPYLTEKGSANEAFNVRANEQYGALAKRDALNLYADTGHSLPVTGLHRFYKSDGTKYTIATGSTFIDYVSDAGAITNIGQGKTSGKRWTFVTYKDTVIGFNGYDNAFKWDGATTTTADTDGARTAGDVITDLGAPFAELNTGANLDASSWYQYKVAFYDGTTYKYSTARSNPILTGATVRDIRLTDIPLGPAGTTYRYIYRTVGNASRAAVLADTSYYKVVSINDNSTTTYNDTMDDATLLGDATPKWSTVSAGENVTPPKATLSFIHKERIFAGNDPSGSAYGKSTLYFCELLNPNYWRTSTNYFYIRPDDGDEITFITSILSTLTIGKTNTISKIYTENASTSLWQLSQPFSFIGCVAPYSAQSTPMGIFYLGRYGIYKFDGQNSQLISDVVTDDIKDISQANLGNVASTYYKNEYRMAYTAQSTGAGANDRTLIYDVIRDSYTKDTEKTNCWAIFNSADDFGGLYSGSSANDSKIFAHSSQPNNFIIRYKSEVDAGTTDSVVSGGTETAPTMTLGWDKTWTTVTGTWATQGSRTWLVDDTTGYWWSAVSYVGANAYEKLYWNSVLPANTTATVAIRSASTAAGVLTAAWSSEFSDPSGSDISGETANNYVQLRVKLTTTDYTVVPYLHVLDNFMLKMVYSKTGTTGETSVLSFWKSGWMDLGSESYSNYPKIIKEVVVYYEGTDGTLTFDIVNLKGDVTGTFSIDLSKNPGDTNDYFGQGNSKVFRWLAQMPPDQTNYLYGDKFTFAITETGTTTWKIQRISVIYDISPYRTYTNYTP